MADLKTTAEERASLRELLRGDASSVRAWRVAEDACDDVDTLLAEDAKLRAVAEAARALIDAAHLSPAEEVAYRTLDAALDTLEAP